ncbi:hypothetical protein FGB62_357g04 [Gracilaria domingensis]|nr:hypothetical protein FGB62_357g04 [Gracilaria domingensis]
MVLPLTAWAAPPSRQASMGCMPPEEGTSSNGTSMREIMPCEDKEYITPSPSPYYEDGHKNGDEGFQELIKWAEQCFPADSEVEVQEHGTIKLRELEKGQLVKQSNGEFSTVFAFTHRLKHGVFQFRRLCTGDDMCMTASHGHYVYGENKLVAAGAVRVDDYIELGNGSLVQVKRVEDVWRKGLYNPQTNSGELVVDGFRVSCYTMSVRPVTAQSLLAPLRAAFLLLGLDLTGGSLDNVGSHWMGAEVLRGESVAGYW